MLAPPFMTLSAEAAAKIAHEAVLMNCEPRLRVAIEGGGCSGFRYHLSFDETLLPDDAEVRQGGVVLVTDPISLQYLQGAEMIYEGSLMGEQLTIRNPNASSTCGCGQSFA